MKLSAVWIGSSLIFCACLVVPAQCRVISSSEVAATDESGAESEEEILARIFGSKRKHPKNMLMEFTLLLDGEKIGEVMVMLHGSQKKVFARHLKDALSAYMTADEIKKIDAIADKDGFADIESISFSNMKAKFNSLTLQLEITANVNVKKTRSLGKRSSHRDIPNVVPAFFSGFISTRLSQTHEGGSNGLNSTTLLLTPALNINGVVLEGEFSYNSGFRNHGAANGGKFYREYTSLVYDLPERDMRFSLGDVFSNSIEYQNVPRVMGFGFKKFAPVTHFDNQNRNVRITLLRRSTIEVYVNDTLVSTKRDVAPGTYTLDDIPFGHGSNDVKIRITDDTGRRQELDSNLFLDSAILEKGESSYGLTVGYPEIRTESRRYDSANPLVSGFFRYGLLDSLECSFGIQANKIATSYTAGLKHASDFGIFDFRYARSHNKSNAGPETQRGNAFYVSYSSPTLKMADMSVSAGVSFEKLSSFFFPYLANAIGDPVSPPPLVADGFIHHMALLRTENLEGNNSNIRYHLSLGNVLGTTWNFNYSIRNRFNQPREKGLSLMATKFISFEEGMFQHAHISASLESIKSPNYKNTSFSLTCSLSIKDSCTVSVGYYDADRKSGNFSISKYSDENGLGYDLSYNGSAATHSYGANLLYNHARFKANIHHYGDHGRGSGHNTTQAGFESTLFFADGAFSVARNNIYDGGFVIVEPENELKETNIKFMNNKSESGSLGGAVLTTTRKQINVSRLDLRNMPHRLEVKKDTIISDGLYKRGACVKISSEGSHMARGLLLDSSGNPLDLVNGYALHTSDKNANPLQFFTNTSGRFSINGLRPGRYRVTVNVEDCEDFEIEIPAGKALSPRTSPEKTAARANNVLDLGVIIVGEKTRSIIAGEKNK
jgi:outer membrane usher protein